VERFSLTTNLDRLQELYATLARAPVAAGNLHDGFGGQAGPGERDD
jgi:hypothetical protein